MENLNDENKIFHLYTKYRHSTYNKILTSNLEIAKFKEKISNYDKIFKEMTNNEFKQMKPDDVMVYIKEDNATKVVINEEEKKEEKKEKEEEKKEINLNNNPLEKKQKTFLILGGYQDIINALLKRGWKQLTDENDMSFDYIYTLKSKKIPHQDLKPNQMSGHFWKASEITRKAGLLHNIKNLYYKGVNLDNFFPRSYELCERNDLEDFIEDFKTNKAISILKETLIKKGINVNKEIVETAINIVKRKIPIINEEVNVKEKFDSVKGRFFNSKKDDSENLDIKLISDEEWEIIGNENMDIYNENIDKLIKQKMLSIEGRNPWKKNLVSDNKNKKNNSKRNSGLKKVDKKNIIKSNNDDINKIKEDEKKLEEEIKEMFKQKALEREKEKEKLNEKIEEEEIKRKEKEKEELEKKEKEQELKKEEEEKEKEEEEEEEKKILTKEEKEQQWKDEFLKEKKTYNRPNKRQENENCEDLIPEIENLISKIKKNLPEFSFDGTKNVWIVKPGGLSRGRGIHCIDQLNDILSDIKICGQTIIQKYIENPLIILNKKFDIRQWVLVTDLSPLKIWLFDTPYIRFSAENYNIDDFKNIFSQLTNNSIAKHSENFNNESKIEGDMWEIEQFRNYLINCYGKDYWSDIQEKIKKIVIYTLVSSKHKIIQRKNTHEVFGYDIMVDDKLNVYLIEINASPDWTYSTKVTEKLVKIASEDIIKVVVDYAEEELKDEKDRKIVDTGRFKLIFNSNDFPKFDNMNVNIYEVDKIKNE